VNEADYKEQIVDLLQFHGFHVETHEDKRKNYIPDVSASGCGKHIWIEVKYADRVPVTLDSIPHYTRGQQNWLAQRNSLPGSPTFLWLGTREEHFIWPGCELGPIRGLPIMGKASRLKAVAADYSCCWDSSFPAVGTDFIRQLRRR
jgi:hypothetical protein